MKLALPFLCFAAAATATSNGLRLTYFAGKYCSGKRVGLNSAGLPETMIAEGKCSPNPAPTETIRSVRVKGLEGNHRYYNNAVRRILRFYSSEGCETSCKQSNIIEETDWDECIDLSDDVAAGRSLQSFNIVEEGETGYGYSALDRAFCFLNHGDEITARGRQWKMQQVAAGFFREIPIEEWDDTAHEQNTTLRFAMHGDVDSRGVYKFWQDSPNSLEKVEFEEWDEMEHPMITDSWQRRLQSFKWRLEDVCEEVPRDKLDDDGFVTITDGIRVSCGGYTKKYDQDDFDYSQSFFY